MIDRTGGGYSYLVYILYSTYWEGTVPLYLCTWEVRYFEKSLPWEVLDPRLLSHIDTLLFFESRKGMYD